jgi:hypothetical protein
MPTGIFISVTRPASSKGPRVSCMRHPYWPAPAAAAWLAATR